MGRHHMKLPDHLYLSPPHPPPSAKDAPSFLSLKAATVNSVALFTETSSSALAVGDHIPGFKTSAAFLQTLRANLALSNPPNTPSVSDLSTPPSSSTSTPDSLRPINMASSTGSLAPLSPSPLAQSLDFPPPDSQSQSLTTAPTDPLADIPALTTHHATTDAQKIPALKLIADSVAQQRQTASRAIIFHPLTLSLLVLLLAAILQVLYHGRPSDLALVATTFIGAAMAVLVGVRWAVSPYIDEAERVGTWGWLGAGRDGRAVGTEDEFIYTAFGDEVVGAVLFRGVRDDPSHPSSSPTTATSPSSPPPSAEPSPKKSTRKANTPSSTATATTKALIRGWTVKQRYRTKGLGTALLDEVVTTARARGWAAGVAFADDHANHMRLGLLGGLFDGVFVKAEARARAALERLVAAAAEQGEGDKGEKEGGRRKKR